MAKRLTVLFVVLAICCCSLTSCFIVINNGNKTGAGNTVDEFTLPDRPKETFPPETDVLEVGEQKLEYVFENYFDGKNYDGMEFSIVVVGGIEKYNIEAEHETAYSRALQIQQDFFNEKTGIKINVREVEYSMFMSDVQAAKNAGLFYCDLICVPQSAVGYMRSTDLLMNLNGVYGDIFTEDYFNADSKIQTAGNNAVYGIAGMATLRYSSYNCVYFNKDTTNAYGVTDEVYASVKNGSWTIDKMLEFKAACSGGHSTATAIGATDNISLMRALFGSSGMRYMNTGVSVVPTIADNGDRLNSFINKMKTMLFDGTCVFYNDIMQLFEAGNVLFSVGTLQDALTLKNNFGILPLPKFDSSQEGYYSTVDENAKVFAVLTTNDRPEYVPDLLRSINGTAQLVFDGWTRDLVDYVLRDSESYSNIRMIVQNARYDFAYMFGGNYPSVALSTYSALEDAVLSRADYHESVKQQEEKLSNDIAALFP